MANKRPHPDDSDSDSEWEYEYSTTETEVYSPFSPLSCSFLLHLPFYPISIHLLSPPIPNYPPFHPDSLILNSAQTFYATIDISSLGPTNPTHGGSRAKRQKPSTPALTTRAKKAQSQNAAQKAATGENTAATEADNDGNETAQLGNVTEAEADPLAETGIDEAEAADDVDGVTETEKFESLGSKGNDWVNIDKSQIQILDLHTTNPIINYLGTLYSCSWTTPLGTDIILTTEPAEPSIPDAHHSHNSYPSAANTTLFPATDTTGRYTLSHSFRIKQDEKAKLARARNDDEDANPNGNGREPEDDEPPHPILAFSELRLMARPMKAVPLSEEKRGKKRGRPRKEPVDRDGATAATTTDNAGQDGGDVQEVPDMALINDADGDEGDVPVRARSPSPSQQLVQSPPLSPPSTNNTLALEPVKSVPDPAAMAEAVPTTGRTTSPAISPPAAPPLSPAPQPSKPSTSTWIPPSQRSSTAAPIDLSAVLTPDSSHARTAQKNFLERLINAKKSLGETDEVTVYASKVNTGTGWRSQERQKKAAGKEKGSEVIQIEDQGEDGVDAGSHQTEGDGAREVNNNGGGAGALDAQLSRREETSIRAVTTRVAPRQGYGTSGKVRRKPGRPPKTVHWQAGDTRRGGSDDTENELGEKAGPEGSETVMDSPTAAKASRNTGGYNGYHSAGADAIAWQDRTLPVPNDLQNPASVVAEALEPPRLTSANAAPRLNDVPEDTVKLRDDANASSTDVEMGIT